MTDKINFPTDWTQMTDDGVAENIKYLTKNRKKYNVSVIDANSLQIDGVRIVFYTIEQHRQMIKVAKINNRNVRSDKNASLYLAIKNLYDTCKQDNIRKYERQIKKDRNFVWLGTSCVIATIICATLITTNAEIKKQEKEKRDKIEWAKKLLQEYEQEKAKNNTVNIDSLINQHIR